jgi:hypothetical protein
MSFNDFDESSLHDECVPQEDVFTYVCENLWDEMEDAIETSRGRAWVLKGKPCLELLSVAAQIDRANTHNLLRRRLDGRPQAGELSDDNLIEIATNASRLLEQLAESIPGYNQVRLSDTDTHRIHEPTTARALLRLAETCGVGEDVSWAKDLLTISRAFRDILSTLSDGEVTGTTFQTDLREPIQVLNCYLLRSAAQPLVYWTTDEGKKVGFAQCPDPEIPNLSTFLAGWIAEYMKNYYPRVQLGTCAECGRFIERERRDKAFCSKTCQNRAAYKRKKIFESDALEQITVAPDDACDIETGLWLQHPRFGIGLIESVGNDSSPMGALMEKTLPGSAFRVRFRSMLSRQIHLKVRFLHGMRILVYSDLFEGEKKEDQVPTFYRAKSNETLAKLL